MLEALCQALTTGLRKPDHLCPKSPSYHIQLTCYALNGKYGGQKLNLCSH